ncbi:MAG: OmpA family protein [Saprospiraceae bacterium]|jgi:outer membrane protein OmpA-like peptidoglycan-associated protein
MARRLTVFSKFLITLGILAGIVFGGRYVLTETEFGRELMEQSGYTLPEVTTDGLLNQLKGEKSDDTATSAPASSEGQQGKSGKGLFQPGVIYFEEGKSSLGPNGKALLDLHMSGALPRRSETAKVLVEGHTDTSEQSEDNLALERAKGVAEYLKSAHGLGSDQVAILSIGSERPVEGCESSPEECAARNRRVRIQVLTQ